MTPEQIKEARDWLDALTGYTPGPWRYRPQQYDDWGYVRGAAEEGGWMPFICQAKDMRATEDDENAARQNKTDPWAANARFIAAAPDLRDRYAAALDEIERLRATLTEIHRDLSMVCHDLQGRVDGGKLAMISRSADVACIALKGDDQ